MKKKKYKIIISTLTLLLFLSGCSTTQSDININKLSTINKKFVSGLRENQYNSVAKAGNYELSFNQLTAAIKVTNLNTGTEWDSNPKDKENDEIAGAFEKDKLSSQFSLYYYDQNNELKSMDSYTQCVKKSQFRMDNIDDGIRVTYTLGSYDRGAEYIPVKLSDERFNALFLENNKLDKSDKSTIKKRYRKENNFWIFKKTTSNIIIEEIIEILDKIGYTEKMLIEDNNKSGIKTVESSKAVFEVTIEYKIEANGLTASIPMDKIKYTSNVKLTKIELLEFFGCAKNKSEGYIFIPDGSGALIDFSPNLVSADTLSIPVYGIDSGLKSTSSKVVNQTVRMPVFGIKNGNRGVFAVIQDGDALSEINTYIAGNVNSYNVVYPSFKVKETGYVNLGNGDYETKVLSFQKHMYQGHLKVKYFLLEDENATYSGMASAYRNYLVNTYNLKKLPQSETPFSLETIGSVVRNKTVLIFNTVGRVPLTDFSQNQMLVTLLKQKEINNINLVTQAWMNGGFSQTTAKKINPLSILGGKSGYQNLALYCKNENIDLFSGINFLTTSSKSSFFNNTIYAKTIDQAVSKVFNFDIVTGKQIKTNSKIFEGYKNIINPNQVTNVTSKFINSYEKYKTAGILTDMGTALYGNYDERKTIDRQSALTIIEKETKDFSSIYKLAVSGGNIYCAVYSKMIKESPMFNSGYALETREIPFYQMVLHGYINLTGEIYNLSDDRKTTILKMLESGVGMSVMWMFEPSDTLKDTQYDYLYSICYKNSFDEVVSEYKKLDSALRDTANQEIVCHERLIDGVYKTSYKNGISIIVNYTKEPYITDNVRVEAQGYLRIEK